MSCSSCCCCRRRCCCCCLFVGALWVGTIFFSLSTDVLFSQKIVECTNETEKPRDMAAAALVKSAEKKVKSPWKDNNYLGVCPSGTLPP